MSTSATLENAAPAAMVTYVPPGESAQRTIELNKAPFVVGRSETTDLHLASNRVSREHAVLTWEEDQFWVRDLGSTNGTFVNGEQIEFCALKRGDLLRIADIDVTLEWSEAGYEGQGDVVGTVRSWQEMLIRRGASCGFMPVWRLSESRIGGYMAVGMDAHTNAISQWPASGLKGSRVSRRIDGLMLVRAIELAAELPPELPLLLAMEDEVDADRWLTMLAALRADRVVYVRLPHNTLAGDRLSSQIRGHGMKVASRLTLGETCGVGADQFWLAKELTEGIADDETRWQPLSDLIRSANDAGAEVLAGELADENAAHVCAELGCAWGTGPLFGGPCAASELGE